MLSRLIKLTWRSSLRTLRSRGTLVVAGCAVAGMALASQPAAACPGEPLAQRAGTAFIKAARSGSPTAFANALQSYADMRKIALFALGKHRRQLPASQVPEFVNLTSRYVASTLADFSRKFRADSVRIINCSGNKVESDLLQLGGRPPQRVVWRIASGKVSDVNVQNVWLAQLLRSNFDSIIKKGGGDVRALLNHLRSGG